MLRVWFIIAAFVVLGVGCGDDPSTSDDGMVTVTGTVRDVDSGTLAADVHVFQWGTSYKDAYPTGTDGAFELKVPRGTKLLLATDDFNPAIDEWFPMMNVDIVPIVANDDVFDVPIDACPNVAPGAVGSLAIWERYLADCDDTENGDMFQPRHLTDAGGILASLVVSCAFQFIDSISFDAGIPEAPIGYVSSDVVTMTPQAPVASQCNIFRPANVTQTDPIGWAQGFFDTTLTASSVNLTIVDNNTSRGIEFPASINLPIAKGVVSMLVTVVDNNKAYSFPARAKKCGFIP